jgi:hypothetical protein
MYVDFFSFEGERLGDKKSLDVLIHNITSIARNALHNQSLSNFSIDEQISWAKTRQTTIGEDKFYCLLGIFDVSMLLIYGEGKRRRSGGWSTRFIYLSIVGNIDSSTCYLL